MNSRPTRTPGRIPAEKSLPTEVLVTLAKRITAMLGGMMPPMVDDAAVTDAE